jgi:hypothetical protein
MIVSSGSNKETVMPRIAVAVGTFVLAAFSIGFNTVRYPLVWDMVGSSSLTPESIDTLHPATTPRPASVTQPQPSARPITPAETAIPETEVIDHGTTVIDTQPQTPLSQGDNRIDSPPVNPRSFATSRPKRSNLWAGFDSPNTSNTQDSTDNSPVDVPSTESTDGVLAGSQPSVEHIRQDDLASLSHAQSPATQPDQQSTPASPVEPTQEATTQADPMWQVHRLPPIDQVASPPTTHQGLQPSGTPLPVYPETGV